MTDNIAFRFLVRIESVQGLENLPARGAAIIMINHIAFVDPVVVLGVLPRNIVPLAKVEVYSYPVFGIFPWLWEVIPVHRGDIDRKALRSAEEVLRAGEVILVAPEGTRHPAMQAGKEGIAFLAQRTGAMIVPVTVEGTEGFPTLPISRRWREPGVQIRVGKPFRLVRHAERPSRETLRRMTDQAMGVLARMLPEGRRGVYGSPEKIETDMLDCA
jgi:1-acyl-sn-glycerol-3-phosphate acyltransferase